MKTLSIKLFTYRKISNFIALLILLNVIFLFILSITLANGVKYILPSKENECIKEDEVNKIPAQQQLSSILLTDGSINVNKCKSGSFNTSGYQMKTRQNGSPYFIPIMPPNGGDPDTNWHHFGEACNDGSTDGPINTIVVIGEEIYIGGDFTLVNGLQMRNISKWDGTKWNALNQGVDGRINALATNGSDVYAGGDFLNAGGSQARYVAKWNGVNWNSLGVSGPSGGPVNAIAIDENDDVYVGGYFETVAGTNCRGIAKWNGLSWSALGTGVSDAIFNASVNAIAIIDNFVYAGGFFSIAGGINAGNIAKWNGSSWSAIGGVNGTVNALLADNGDLYVGGEFTRAAGIEANHIAIWDGVKWDSLGSGILREVLSIAIFSNEVYVSGDFAKKILKWNGTKWDTLTEQFLGFGNINALAFSGDILYAGGYVLEVAGETQDIIRWTGDEWQAICDSTDNGIGGGSSYVYAIAVVGNDVYIGGDFENAGGVAANNVARWDGKKWNALGGGANDEVYAIATNGSEVYFGGYFNEVDGIMANRIAKWDGNKWSSLSIGISGGPINAIAVHGNDVYVGGSFSEAGLAVAKNVAKWDGVSWSALGTGISSSVKSIATNDGINVYVGGYFSKAGEVTAHNIAMWNGSEWGSLGIGSNEGTNENVYSIALTGSDVYIGGYFSQAGGGVVNRVAKWDGASWSALGFGLESSVQAIAVNETILYAVGDFEETVEGIPVTRIAKWDGSSWNALGSGLDKEARALALNGCNVYVGGNFELAGLKESHGIAVWRDSLLCEQECSISNIDIIGIGSCDSTTNEYEIQVLFEYLAQAGNEIEINIGGQSFQRTISGNGHDILSFSLLANGDQGIDITTHFMDDPSCTSTLTDAYNEPESCITSIQDPSLFGINYYPNPFTETLIIDFQTDYALNWDIQIFDVLGRSIELNEVYIQERQSTVEFSFKSINSGIYSIIFSKGNIKTIGKIIKVE